jgi:hypothetical protein
LSLELAERRGNPGHLVIDDGDIDNLRLANAGRVMCYRVQYRLHVSRRIGDYAENVGDRRLLLERLVQLAVQPRDRRFLPGHRGTAMVPGGLYRIGAFSHYRFAASHFSRSAAFLEMLSHCPLKEGYGARLAHTGGGWVWRRHASRRLAGSTGPWHAALAPG